MNATYKFGWLVLGVFAIMLAGCNPQQPQRARLDLRTTISADGQVVAALLNAGTERQRLRVLHLDRADGWQDVQGPPLSQTIRFGLQGHDLLITHRMQNQKRDRLVALNVDTPDVPALEIYEDDELGFPIEVSPGRFMVRTCPNRNNPGAHQCRLAGYRWLLVGPDKQIQQVGPDSVEAHPSPNIVGLGGFWVIEQVGNDKAIGPTILTFAFPDGQSPEVPNQPLDKNTYAMECDQSAKRCLRRYISNLDGKGQGAFIYDIEASFGASRCKLEGVSGFADGMSITPDGRAAVVAIAPAYDKPRRVVVLRFDRANCVATSIQHIEFQEK